MMQASTINGVNRLPEFTKRETYARIIAPELLQRFHISSDLLSQEGIDLLTMHCSPGSSSVEMELRHIPNFEDPILFGHLTDNLTGQVHILLYVLNDPDSPRFNVDKMPDGRKTFFGTQCRNLEAELAAMQFGLAPGQIRRGLRLLNPAIRSFEDFVTSLGHELYFTEPLYYHNAIIFEHYGFSYTKGKKLMERIQKGFSPTGDLLGKLDGSSPFRAPSAASSIRMRSWAIHDGILGEPFTDVTMFKHVGKSAGMDTSSGCGW
jgi:hypothetical protein